MAGVCGLLLACPGSESRALPVAPSYSIADTARQIGTRRGWNVYLAEPCADTVSAAVADVVGAARRTFEADQWRVQNSDVETGQVLTRWKDFHHPLVRMLMGKIQARCAVAARSFQSNRTIVIFQGGIAARDNLDGNPGLVLARRAYRNAARDWGSELRADLRSRNALRVESR